MNSVEQMEIFKFVAALAIAATTILAFGKMYFDTAKAKTSIDPQLSQTMVSNIEKDGHVRREYMESMKTNHETSTKILERLAENSIKMTENYHQNRQRTEELHALTRKAVDGLSDALMEEIKTVQSNQTAMIKLVDPISKRFEKEAA